MASRSSYGVGISTEQLLQNIDEKARENSDARVLLEQRLQERQMKEALPQALSYQLMSDEAKTSQKIREATISQNTFNRLKHQRREGEVKQENFDRGETLAKQTAFIAAGTDFASRMIPLVANIGKDKQKSLIPELEIPKLGQSYQEGLKAPGLFDTPYLADQLKIDDLMALKAGEDPFEDAQFKLSILDEKDQQNDVRLWNERNKVAVEASKATYNPKSVQTLIKQGISPEDAVVIAVNWSEKKVEEYVNPQDYYREVFPSPDSDMARRLSPIVLNGIKWDDSTEIIPVKLAGAGGMAFLEMNDQRALEGLPLLKLTSGKREISEQAIEHPEWSPERWKKGKHVTGDAVDIKLNYDYEGENVRDWLALNGPRYGFIPTVKAEEHHYEYVGTERAVNSEVAKRKLREVYKRMDLPSDVMSAYSGLMQMEPHDFYLLPQSSKDELRAADEEIVNAAVFDYASLEKLQSLKTHFKEQNDDLLEFASGAKKYLKLIKEPKMELDMGDNAWFNEHAGFLMGDDILNNLPRLNSSPEDPFSMLGENKQIGSSIDNNPAYYSLDKTNKWAREEWEKSNDKRR